MALFENYPYTNLHNLNIDWVIKMIKELNDKFDAAITSKIQFADPIQWDITKQYPPLTLVIDNNKAYLSMQSVPAGMPLSNTDYWQNIFDMSELYNEVDQLREDVESEVGQLREDVESEVQEISDNTVKNNNSKKVLWIGDSYSTWNNGTLYNTFLSASGLNPDNCHNLAVSGAGFVSDGSTLFLAQVQGYTGDRNEITDIIVCGGINDAKPEYTSSATVTPLTNAINTFCNYCKTNYPNAKINIAFVGGTLPTSSYYETLHPNIAQEWALWAYSIHARGQGCKILRTWNTIHLSHYNYNTDGLHPNNTGSIAIGESVASAFNDNPIITNRPREVIYLRHTGVNARDASVFAYINDDIVSLETPDNYFQITSGNTIGQENWIPIFTFESCKIRSIKFTQCRAILSGFSGMTGGVEVTMELKIEDGVISMKVFHRNASGYDTYTASSFSAVTFLGLPEIMFPVWQMN